MKWILTLSLMKNGDPTDAKSFFKAREIKVSQKGLFKSTTSQVPCYFRKSEWEVIIGMIPEIQQFITDRFWTKEI